MKLFVFVLLACQQTIAFSYTQKCRHLGEDFVRFAVIVASPALTFKVTAYEDETCEIPYIEYLQYFTIESVNGLNIDLKTEKVTYSPISEEVASALRQISYCGTANWEVSVETEVTGQNCDGFVQLRRGAYFYQLLQQNPRSLGFGVLDKQHDGRSAHKRPVKFDELYFLKN